MTVTPRAVVKCSRCDRRLNKGDARGVLSSKVWCGDCLYLDEQRRAQHHQGVQHLRSA